MKYLPLVYLVLTIAITSCQPIGRPTTTTVDPVLQPYVSAFIKECDVRKVHTLAGDLTVQFKPSLPGMQIGVCHREGGVNTVTVSKEWYDRSTDIGHEQLIYHELGHCMLDREHDDDQLPEDGTAIDASIMATYHMDDFIYKSHHEYYLNELFR